MSVYDKELPSSGGIYHKFENDVTYTFRLCSEPIVVVSTFKGNESTSYAWLAWNVENGIPQIVKLPVTAARQIWAIVKEKGEPTHEYSIRMTRTGSGFDTKYDIQASPHKSRLEELAAEAEEKLAKVDPIEAIRKGNGIVDVYYLAEAEDGGSKNRSESQPAPVSDLPPIDESQSKPTDDETW